MEKDSLEYNTLKGKISQILLKNKAIYGALEGYNPLSGESEYQSVTLSPHIYNQDSEYIIDNLDKVGNVDQLEDMIYKHCRKMGEAYDDKGNLIGNLVPEQPYKEGKYKKIAQEIFPLIKKDY